MSHKLLVKDSRGQREILLVGTMTVGRDPRCDISDPDPLLSRRHAEFSVNAAGVQVRDLNSRNGIVVNGKKTPQAQLQAGDVVQISQLAITLLSGAPARPVPTAAEGGEEKTMLITPASAASATIGGRPAGPATSEAASGVEAGGRVHSSEAGTMRVARAAVVAETPEVPAVNSSSATIHVPRERMDEAALSPASGLPLAVPPVEAHEPPPPAAAPEPPPAEPESDRTRFSPPPAFVREQKVALPAQRATSSATVATGPPPAPEPQASPPAPPPAVISRPAAPSVAPVTSPAWGATAWNTTATIQIVGVAAAAAVVTALLAFFLDSLLVAIGGGLAVAVAGGLVVAASIGRAVSGRLARLADDLDLAVVGKKTSVADPFGDRSGGELADALNELLTRVRSDGR